MTSRELDQTTPTLRPLFGVTRSQEAARVLRGAIIGGTLPPGERLIEADLALQLGTSNGPVRDALRQLEAEGLVVRLSYRSSVVAEVSEDEVEEVLIPVRLTIESFAFRRANSVLGRDDFRDLHDVLEAMRVAAESGDDDGVAEADFRFHEIIIERAGRNHCVQLWRVIQPRVRAYFHSDTPVHRNPLDLVASHEDLLATIEAGNEEQVLAMLEPHIRDRPRNPSLNPASTEFLHAKHDVEQTPHD